MLERNFDGRLYWVIRLGIVANLIGLLCAPLALHAADTAEKANTQHDEMKPSEMKKPENSHDKMNHGKDNAHSHRIIDVSDWDAIPRVSMKVEKDGMSGWNIYIELHDFLFTPENVNGENQEGEGHAHLYVDEKKVARLYSSWFHLPALPAGKHSIKLQLNANDHSALAVGHNPIEIITIVTEE